MSEQYKLIFTGQIAAGFSQPEVEAGLARLFKTEVAKIALMFSGQAVVLRKGLDEATAGQYLAALAKVGALAERWMALEAAWAMTLKGAWLYDQHQPCGAEANAAKFLGARAGYESCLQAVLTHGGFGYAKEYHVERLLREVTITRIAPVTEQMILSFIAEKVLDLPKSY